MINNLPNKAKKLYTETYNAVIAKGKNKSFANKVALSMIEKKFKKHGNRYIARSKALLKLTLARNGLFNKIYTLSSPVMDLNFSDDGIKIPKDVVQDVLRRNAINRIGDLEHHALATKYREKGTLDDLYSKFDKETLSDSFGLYELNDFKLENDMLYMDIGLNKNHKLYNKMLEEHKQGKYLGLSIEAEGIQYDENDVPIYIDRFGFSVTDEPLDSKCHGTLEEKII